MDPSCKRYLDTLDFNFPEELISDIKKSEVTDTISVYEKYVSDRLNQVDSTISILPTRSDASLLKLAQGARDIAKMHMKYPLRLKRSAYNDTTAVLYAMPLEYIETETKKIIEAYNYLYRVALGIIQKRNGQNYNLLPLDKDSWLEPCDPEFMARLLEK